MELSLHNRQRKVRFDLEWLREIAPAAAEAVCFSNPSEALIGYPALAELPVEVEVTFVSDATIADVHRRFMNIPGPTDVITFDHGEIVISAETALENSKIHGKPLDEELALYLIHGLLHLRGFDDKEPQAAAAMSREQERILAGCLLRTRKRQP